MLIDYHIHTNLCGHAEGEMEEYVKSAVSKKVDEIGFSDHFPLFHVAAPDLSMSFDDLPIYINKVTDLRRAYRNKIRIKLGIEVEYTAEIEKQTRELLKEYSFDYIIGSTHFVGKWVFDHPDHKDEWKKRDVCQVYEEYFAQLCRMVDSGLFDIVGHADLVKKFGYKPKQKLTALYEKLAGLVRKRDMCLEVNTSGLHRPVKEIYPAEELLEICFKKGIPVTLGSDAHTPEDVARDFDKAMALIRSVGYRKIAVFSARKRSLVSL